MRWVLISPSTVGVGLMCDDAVVVVVVVVAVVVIAVAIFDTDVIANLVQVAFDVLVDFFDVVDVVSSFASSVKIGIDKYRDLGQKLQTFFAINENGVPFRTYVGNTL